MLDEPDVDAVAGDARRVSAPHPREARLEAVARLTPHGISASKIAERLHTTFRTVVRLRGALRETAT